MWTRSGLAFTARTKQRQTLRRWILFALCSLCAVARRQPRSARRTDIRSALKSCANFEVGFEAPTETGPKVFPNYITDVMGLVDHTFILSLSGCETRVPRSLANRSTCILGELLDSCAPSEFTTGPYKHALKVSFMHAVVLDRARSSGFRHAMLIEDDITLHRRKFSQEFSTDFQHLLDSHAWSIIRFGFRPFFLQSEGASRCSTVCRCLIGRFGAHLCRLRRSGCDLRSSDFYVIKSDTFLHLRDRILDRQQPTTRRIVDLHPMRSVGNQWLVLPQVSSQRVLDIPTDYQIGLGAAYVHKCAGPRPLPDLLLQQTSSY